ncbi:hypothetical protein TSUD_283260 [Trifolium subterraneum]|uniref:F-box domain-containing protein n=1 Tax=Trifolium subterraneum TaxID=3900 RepID=A0A2Z6P9P8_TRISU|nr:hypothetical protein TSUD_283260 [Trifolium subterraneum]
MIDQRDILGSLSPCLKGQILSNLPLKEAARTSILSRRWCYTWLVIPSDIIFEDTSITKFDLVLLIDQVVASWIGPAKTFKLPGHSIIGNFHMHSSNKLDTWILILRGRSLEED